jgi:hypothetical protein
MQIIKDKNHVTIRRNRRRRFIRCLFPRRGWTGGRRIRFASPRFLHRKFRDHLRFAFVEQLEIFLLKSSIDLTFFIADYHANQNQV